MGTDHTYFVQVLTTALALLREFVGWSKVLKDQSAPLEKKSRRRRRRFGCRSGHFK